MGFGGSGVRVTMLALMALALAACAQARDAVLVGVGIEAPAPAKARDYAALYLPYAMMATAAYTDPDDLNRTTNCPDPDLLRRPPPTGTSAKEADFRASVRGWIAQLNGRGWACYSGVVGSLPCPERLGRDCKPVGGLEFHIWRRMTGRSCIEVAIAFRGTDKNDVGDWTSNLRWLYRLAPKFDQYAQVQDHIRGIVGDIRAACGDKVQIVSAGHSLGGGLAQQAAYAGGDRGIRYVYAFDPSPVTGFFDVSAVLREQSVRGLGVDRTYESGEILVLPRLIIENIFPPLACNPRIRSVRFNLLGGLPGSQHSISDLTREIAVTAKGGHPKQVEDGVKAASCTPVPFMLPPPA